MRIQHNIPAMSSYRNYTNNTKALSKNLERLSSGYKINRAGDDAAGLAISEKMRAQITGLEVAQKNSKDGISLIQTAEGALTEVHDMLNRMYELAEQSANGTYEDSVDRTQLQKEVEQLKSEINRIADASNFNGIKLLNGELGGTGVLEDATNITITKVEDGDQTVKGGTQKGEFTIDFADLKIAGVATASGGYSNATLSLEIGGATLAAITIQASEFTGGAVLSGADIVGKLTETEITMNGLTFTVEKAGSVVTLKGKTGPTSKAQQTTFEGTALSLTFTLAADATQNHGFDQSVHVVEKVLYGAVQPLAQGSFSLDKIEDGTTITIGTDSYSFKVGKNGKGGTGTVIDLSDMEITDADFLTEAARRLSAKGKDNSKFDVTTHNSGHTIYLTEKAGAVDYKEDWDLQGPTTTQTDATWLNADTGESAVRIAHRGAATGKNLTLQIGDTAESFNQLKVDINDCHADAIGVGKIDIGTQEGATDAMLKIKDAINYVSDVRGTLGATQNRLEHTINNLSVMQENIQDAESTIRDVDVAEEMMAYTKNNILVQSAQAMLAQANQLPQGVLQLLG